ncbi:MAG: hypothetical protein MUF10_07150 [Thermoanaerobaculaceae bacterium]|jgi:hypothetical protein|nr:hypothetical protein [Thermoanaerobaculaceae bacterium]
MRGPVGLLAEPDEPRDLLPFAHIDEEGSIELLVERRLLAPPHLRSGEMLLSIEGHGRFRLRFPDD